MISREARAALDRFEVTGPGGKVPHDDLENVLDYVSMMLASHVPGMTRGEATDLVRFINWGSWAEGWESGYASGARRAAPHFSLNKVDASAALRRSAPGNPDNDWI